MSSRQNSSSLRRTSKNGEEVKDLATGLAVAEASANLVIFWVIGPVFTATALAAWPLIPSVSSLFLLLSALELLLRGVFVLPSLEFAVGQLAL